MRPVLAVLIFFCLSICVRADSLFPLTSNGTPAGSMFTDPKASRAGDILTVVITESANGSTTAATSISKTDNAAVNQGTGGLSWIAAFGLSDSNAQATTGSTSRTDALTGQIAVTVKEVLPNGNLVIQGTRQVGTNNDVQIMTLTGIVRQEDIAANNTVQSPLVADAKISYSGKGPVADKQHEGMISRLFKIFF